MPFTSAQNPKRIWEPATRETLFRLLLDRLEAAGEEKPGADRALDSVVEDARLLLGWDPLAGGGGLGAAGLASAVRARITIETSRRRPLRPPVLAVALLEVRSACKRNPDLLRRMDWSAFEALATEELYRRRFQLVLAVRDQSGSSDLLVLRRKLEEGSATFLVWFVRAPGSGRPDVSGIDRLELPELPGAPGLLWVYPLEAVGFGVSLEEPMEWKIDDKGREALESISRSHPGAGWHS